MGSQRREQIESNTCGNISQLIIFIAHFSDEKTNFRDGERGGPLRPQDVEADGAVAVDVWVVDAGGKGEFRGLEGVICGKIDVEEEHPAWKF